MENDEIIQELRELRGKINQFEVLKSEMENASLTLKRAKSRTPKAVADFDIAYKQSYILKNVGPAPEKPKGIMKLAVPIYRSKMKEYEKECDDYKARYAECERNYYKEYALQRAEMEEKEKKSIAYSIQQAEVRFDSINSRYQEAKNDLDSDEFLSLRLKKIDIVDQLITYFEDKRVDSLKEAINLYYEDEHRKNLEEFAREQLRLTEEAKEYARQAAASSSEAASSAQEAISRVDSVKNRADEAFYKAEEAYSKAEEAYSQAQSAYWAVSSNS